MLPPIVKAGPPTVDRVVSSQSPGIFKSGGGVPVGGSEVVREALPPPQLQSKTRSESTLEVIDKRFMDIPPSRASTDSVL
jgi:hypothetical protein